MGPGPETLNYAAAPSRDQPKHKCENKRGLLILKLKNVFVFVLMFNLTLYKTRYKHFELFWLT